MFTHSEPQTYKIHGENGGPTHTLRLQYGKLDKTGSIVYFYSEFGDDISGTPPFGVLKKRAFGV